jgi:unsaturated pyranuronate lyase
MPHPSIVHRRWSDVPEEALTPSIARRYLTGDRVTVAQFNLRRGGLVPRHVHGNEQVSCVMTGSLKFDFDGDVRVVNAGEVIQIPGGVPHQVEVLADAFVIDVFSPAREDWVNKTDDYFRR